MKKATKAAGKKKSAKPNAKNKPAIAKVVIADKPPVRNRSKLGKLLDYMGINQREFAEMVYEKTGEVIMLTNLSNYCTGYKPIGSVRWARVFAYTLGVTMEEVVD